MRKYISAFVLIFAFVLTVPALGAQNTVTIGDSASHISSNLQNGYLYFRAGLVSYDITAKAMSDFYYNSDIKYYVFTSNGISITADKNNFYDFNLKSVRFSVLANRFEVTYSYTDDSSKALDSTAIPVEYRLSYPAATSSTGVKLNGQYISVSKNDGGEIVFESRILGEFEIAQFEFDDVADSSKWYYGYVNSAGALGILNGVDSKNFEPGGNVTRAQLAAMIVKATDSIISYRTDDSARFNDVPSGKWYYSYIMKCATMGIVNGVGDGSFSPETYATRQEIATVVSRLLKIMGSYDGAPLPAIDSDKSAVELAGLYPDGEQVYKFAQDSVLLCNRLGIMTGDSDGFRPKSNTTRAECAKIFYLINRKCAK